MALLRTIIGVIIVRSASSAITQNFAFQVFQVESCPMSKVDWDSASKRLNCNTTHGYHCVPDKYFTSLIEFCYPHGYRLPFERGNCLELAANGILNHVPCHSTFSSGCPSQFYFSNELYKYQKCLSINTELGCFDADVPCILEKSGFNTTNHTINSVSPVNCTALDKTPSCKTNDTTCTASIVFIFLLFFIIFGMCALFIRAIYWNKRKDSSMKKFFRKNGESSDIFLLLETQSINGDIEFSNLINACRNGEYNQYHLLISKEEIKQTEAIRKTDRKGRNLLHHAVYGGNYDICHDLLKYDELDIKGTDFIGRNVLHIAAKKGNPRIFEKVLQSVQGNEMLDEEDKNGLKPFCYAALAGHVSILDIIKDKGFDIAKQTKYGETIAHLACIGDSLEVLQLASAFNDNRKQGSLKSDKEEENEILKRKNKMNWNPLQYAAKTGNVELLEFLYKKQVSVINPTDDLKYAFHSACENGRLEACKFIFKKCPDSIHDKDKEGRHAGHFAAKSGNVKVLQFLIDECKLKADLPSAQNVSILHIACRHGRFKMCQNIADKYPDLVKKESRKGWNAALFLGDRGGANEERIKILSYLVQKHDLFVYHVSRAGKSILYNACANRSFKLCKHLLENYTDLLTIERSMDLKNGASDKKIINLLEKHLEKISGRD